MDLWHAWLQAVRPLRAACSRHRTFLWMVVVLAGMSVRADRAGVTSFIRAHWLVESAYLRLLHFFHTTALKLDVLTRLWARLAVRLFDRFVVRINGKLVLLADGIKIPKEGRKMPAVKSLHQESECNAKAEFIMGHSCQAVSLLVQGVGRRPVLRRPPGLPHPRRSRFLQPLEENAPGSPRRPAPQPRARRLLRRGRLLLRQQEGRPAPA